MEVILSAMVAALVASGVYLLLRARSFSVIFGYVLLGYAANLMLFASGRLVLGSAPLHGIGVVDFPDPLPQALVLTAIVIGFGMTAFAAVLALRAHVELGGDHVDRDRPGAPGDAPRTGDGDGGGGHGEARGP